MKNRFNRFFKILIAFITILGLSAPATISSAHHVHHPRVRISHQYHRTKRNTRKGRHNGQHGAIRLRRKKHANRTRRLTSREIRRTLNEIDRQTIHDINLDRHHYDISALRINRKLSRVGNFRSHQLQKYFSHNTPTRNNEFKYLINKRHIKNRYCGENIASSPLGTISILAVGAYSNPEDTNSQNFTYHSKDGYQLANNINDASMYHDAGDNNGHRDNILGKEYKQLGVGSSYNSRDQTYYVAVEFIG